MRGGGLWGCSEGVCGGAGRGFVWVLRGGLWGCSVQGGGLWGCRVLEGLRGAGIVGVLGGGYNFGCREEVCWGAKHRCWNGGTLGAPGSPPPPPP